MGRSQKPLRIGTLGEVTDWPELAALKEQGHEVIPFDATCDLDVILGPTCWLMDDAHRKYLPLALAEARKRRYPKEPREQSE